MAKKYVYNPALNAYFEKGKGKPRDSDMMTAVVAAARAKMRFGAGSPEHLAAQADLEAADQAFKDTQGARIVPKGIRSKNASWEKSSAKRYEYNPQLNAYFEKSESGPKKDFVTARTDDYHADLGIHNDTIKRLHDALKDPSAPKTQREALINLADASFNRLANSHRRLASMGVNVPPPQWHEALRASFAKGTRRDAIRRFADVVAVAAGGKAGSTAGRAAADALRDPTLPYTAGNVKDKIAELTKKSTFDHRKIEDAMGLPPKPGGTSRRGLFQKIGAGLAAAGGVVATEATRVAAQNALKRPEVQEAVGTGVDAAASKIGRALPSIARHADAAAGAAKDAIGRLTRSLKHETESAAANPWDLIVNEDGTTISHSVGYDEKGHNGEKSRAKSQAKKKNLKKATRRPFGMPGEGRLEEPGDDHDTSDFGRGQLVASQGRPKRRLEKDLAPDDPKPEEDPKGLQAAMHAMRDFRNAEQKGDWRKEAADSLAEMKIPALQRLSAARNRAGLEARRGDTLARSMKDNRNDDSDEGNELSRDEQNRRDARRKREHVPAHVREHFEQEHPDRLHKYTTEGGNVMAQKFINGDNDDNVTVTKSQADLSMIAQMMSQTFGITPQRVLDNVSKITKSEANLHAVEHGEIFELHQKPSGEFIVAPIGYGSVGDLALPVPSEYADVFEMDLHKAKIRAHQLQKVEMRKSYVEVDSDFHYRDQIDTLLAKAYKFAKADPFANPVASFNAAHAALKQPGLSSQARANHRDTIEVLSMHPDVKAANAGTPGRLRAMGGQAKPVNSLQASWGDGEGDDDHDCPRCGGEMGRRGKCKECGYKQKGYMKAADPELAGKYDDDSNYFAPQPEGKPKRSATPADFEGAKHMRGRGPSAERAIKDRRQ